MKQHYKITNKATLSDLETICVKKGLKLTVQRSIILDILETSTDHPDVEEVYRRAVEKDCRISIATVYRTLGILHEVGILDRHDFKHDTLGSRSRYELSSDEKHDHIIVLETGNIIDFKDDDLNRLREAAAKEMGFKLVDIKLELYVSRND